MIGPNDLIRECPSAKSCVHSQFEFVVHRRVAMFGRQGRAEIDHWRRSRHAGPRREDAVRGSGQRAGTGPSRRPLRRNSRTGPARHCVSTPVRSPLARAAHRKRRTQVAPREMEGGLIRNQMKQIRILENERPRACPMTSSSTCSLFAGQCWNRSKPRPAELPEV